MTENIVRETSQSWMSGVLSRAPLSACITPTELIAPQDLQEDDYKTLSIIGQTTHAPVYMNYTQQYLILADLVDKAIARFGEIIIIIQFTVSYLSPLPKCLLAPHVSLVDSPNLFADKLSPSTPYILIDQDFRRDTIERGDNRITCTSRHLPSEQTFAWFKESFIFPFLDDVAFGILHEEAEKTHVF